MLDEAKYRELFGYEKHPFTAWRYVGVPETCSRAEGCERVFLSETTCAPCCIQRMCCSTSAPASAPAPPAGSGAEKVLLLSDLMTSPGERQPTRSISSLACWLKQGHEGGELFRAIAAAL